MVAISASDTRIGGVVGAAGADTQVVINTPAPSTTAVVSRCILQIVAPGCDTRPHADRDPAPRLGSGLELRFLVPVDVPAGLGVHGRVIAIIPARYHATRLPGKPLALIAGKPMIAHVIARAAAARLVDTVVVATDDARIMEAVDGCGGTGVMTRADHPSGTDRLAEVAQLSPFDTYTTIVNLQGDEPMLDPDTLDAAVAPLLADPSIAMGTVRTALAPGELENPNVVKVVVDLSGTALYFTRAAIPYTRPGHPEAHAWRHLGLYVYRRDTLLRLAQLPPTPLEQAEGLEQLRALEHGIRIHTVEVPHASPSVDTPDDLTRVRALMADPLSSSTQ